MDAADLIGLLTETTLAASAALLLVLGLRRPLRYAFGPTVAYALWLLVPAAIIAVLLPAAAAPAVPVAMVTVGPSLAAPTPVAIDGGLWDAAWLAALWVSGAAIAAVWFAQQQRAFRLGLGQLHRRGDGMAQADSVVGLPAAIGLWQPLIVVPADFDSRYTPQQRRLMQQHERMHIRCGDLQINALATALRCVFWFNPLLHLAARHFRVDQELACDQRVIARNRDARRDYGEAMLKTQLATHPLPLGCHWAVFDKARSHPLKERIAMLKHPIPTLSRWIAGSAVVATLLLGTGVAAWAAQPHSVVPVDAAVVASPAPAVAPQAPRALPASPIVGSAAAGIAPPAPAAPSTPPTSAAPSAPVAPPASSAASTSRVPAPAYPADALARRISGKVVLVIDIDAQGTPTAVEVEKSEPAGVFDQAAIDAAMKWKFSPERRNGKPVASRIRVPVEFKAPAAAAPPAPVSAAPTPVAPAAVVARMSAPTYPAAALASRLSGKVVMAIDIDAQGMPVAVQVEQSEPTGVFDQAAVDAAMKWKFSPEHEDGKPVPGRVRVPIEFKAPAAAAAPTTPSPSQGQPAAIAPSAPASAATAVADAGGGDLICERRKQLGSKMMKRVCMTASQWAQEKARAQEELQQLGRCTGNEVNCTGSIRP